MAGQGEGRGETAEDPHTSPYLSLPSPPMQDIFRVLDRVLPPSCQSSSLPSSFHLLSLGGKGPRRLIPSTDVTLRAAGLVGPTASLLFRWEKGEGRLLPKVRR